ncbi:RHS repeat domain-containing protein [Prosthecobacter sp.]
MKQSLVFLYDGWNMIAEIGSESSSASVPLAAPTLLRSYEWGLDVSDTMDGAGGVGGQLIQRHHLVSGIQHLASGAHAPLYDGNGNITELINLANGNVSARYEYGAFGETISVDGGAVAEANPVRFSTKYLDVETGIVNYELRPYQAATGRFLSRDPIGEQGGINLYGMVGNDPVNKWDYLGLAPPMYMPPDNFPGDDASDDAINSMLGGSNNRRRVFGPTHAWTLEMKKHEWMDKVREEIRQKQRDYCDGKNRTSTIGHSVQKNFNLNEQTVVANARIFLNDILAGLGQTSSVHSTGSFRLKYTILSIDCSKCEAYVYISAWDKLSLRSLTRIPGTGTSLPDIITSALDSMAGPEFTRKGDEERANPDHGNDPLGNGCPLNSIFLRWYWNEHVN